MYNPIVTTFKPTHILYLITYKMPVKNLACMPSFMQKTFIFVAQPYLTKTFLKTNTEIRLFAIA